jgi:hypothetical protein
MKGIRTTLTIDEDLAIQIAEIQKSRKVTFRFVVNSLLRKGLMADSLPEKNVTFVVKSRSLGRPRENVNFDKVNEVLERLDELEGR